MQMSKIPSNVLANASERDKFRVVPEDNEELLNIYLPALLITDESTYHMISDDDLLKYLNGAVQRVQHLQALRALEYCAADEDGRNERYLREMCRCNQVICRLRREYMRRGAKQGTLPIRFRTLCPVKISLQCR